MRKHRKPLVFSILVLFSLLLSQSSPALADGGIVISDSGLWAQIDEGQQIAVIHLGEEDSAQVDLFITMVDRTGRSHEVVFFIPLGEETSDFNVVEERSRDFDEALTKALDEEIRSYGEKQASYKSTVQAELLLGTLVTNGLWTWLISLPILTSSCAQAPQPKATYATESSTIAIYEMNAGMDLDALIATTGLAPGVKQTLEDLKGQEIAVITLQTQPEAEGEGWEPYGAETGQPGIHLTWYTTLAEHPEGGEYVYPLGTGRAWASPIELTRIYIVSPSGTDFKAQFPKLGTDLSGIEGRGWLSLARQIYWKIDRATGPAYAIDEAYGSYGHLWRATYVKSNSDRDLSVIKLAEVSSTTRSSIRQSRIHSLVTGVTWIFSLLLGAVIWLFSWWLVMTRVAKISYQWRDGRLYGDAFLWSAIYPLVTLVLFSLVGMVCGGISLGILIAFADLFQNGGPLTYALVFIASLPLIIGMVGLVNAFFFSRTRAKKLDISMGRAFGAYMLTVLVANVLYAIYAIPYAAIVGAI